MVMCIKQYLSNIWSSIYEKYKQHWYKLKKALLLKKTCSIKLKKIVMFSIVSLTQSFLLGFSWCLDNITASNKKSISKKEPTSVSETAI